MKIFLAPEELCSEGKAVETAFIRIATSEGGPEYRITQNTDGTLQLREVTYMSLLVSPASSNVITIGATY